jgi:phosphatidylserine/phosphatidylglycerophosphate/cardiolipin synthase-like enzyme
VLAVLACQLSPGANPLPDQPTPQLTPTFQNTSGGWYDIYFTDPESPTSSSYRGGPDQKLAEAITRAHVSVDIAVLQLNLWSIRDSLLEAHRRGLTVRMVTDSDYLDEKEVQQLIAGGIPVVDDRQEGLMHNKFVVIDRMDVWTGSMNFTTSDGYRNNNTLLHIHSTELAEDYTTEFEEMFLHKQFGPGSPSNTPYPDLTINGTKIISCFSPEDYCIDLLVQAISQAKKSIHFLAYSFTSEPMAKALIERAAHNIDVKGVMESSQATSNSGGDYGYFLSAGLDVRLDGNPDQMHEKVMIIDGEIVAAGSFNFTNSAVTRNDENLLIIDNPHIAGGYQVQFEKIYNQALPKK